jgi:hypothetical protein
VARDQVLAVITDHMEESVIRLRNMVKLA